MGNPSAAIRPFRIILCWQAAATLLAAAVCAWFAGLPGAVSAVLGGAVAISGSLVFVALMPVRAVATPWDSLGALLRAEGAKVGVIVVLLWLVLATCKGIVVVGFIGTFAVTVIIFSMAIFIRNPASLDTGIHNTTEP